MPSTVLLVDDEEQILSILRETLTATGFSVETCNSGEAAVEYLADHHPDMIVTDLRMPGVSGLEVLQEAQKVTPDTQVIILTGFGDMNSAIEALRYGAYDYLNKPVDAERLVQTLRNGEEKRRLILENRNLIHGLQEANRLKTEFINGMSHEIRTPLGHITGFSEILEATLEDVINEKQARYLKNIQKAADRLLGMFDNILEYSILNSGDRSISPSPFSLRDLLEKGQNLAQAMVDEKSMSVNIELPESAVNPSRQRTHIFTRKQPDYSQGRDWRRGA